MSQEAMHASAPEQHLCADCTMDKEACPTCYAAWWTRRHPNTIQIPESPAKEQPGEQCPLDMVLHCPHCGEQHIDKPEPDKGWTNPPHKSHLCHGCGTIWRPADVPTNGVAKTATTGERDTWFSPHE